MSVLAELLSQHSYYLVYSPEILGDQSYTDDGNAGLYIVKADSEDEAIERYIDLIVEADDIWLSDVYSNSVNMSFAERLWVDDEGQHLFDNRGELRIEYEAAYEKFKQNVNELFEDNPDYAELYLRFWEENEESDGVQAHRKWKFPHEMMKIMYYAIEDWSGGSFQSMAAIRLNEIQELT